MDRVVFLDRDGTLNEEVDYLHRPEDLRILPGVTEALANLKAHGFILVVVTNQAGVARGYYTEENINVLHAFFNNILRPKGAAIDHFFYCPHHPVYGVGPYKTACHCRKPETGMFEMAEQVYEVDKKHSYMIGDKLIDVEAGRNYGVRPVLVGTGYGRKIREELGDRQENNAFDYYAENMLEAADWILNEEGEV